ncbi:15764_t:CDS:2 [Entrophospora sp. SA101]|nr:15764_t:CDS:2 [Entrophospora sp. SA101]
MSVIGNLKIDPALSYGTDVESILMPPLVQNVICSYTQVNNLGFYTLYGSLLLKTLITSVYCKHLMNNEITELEEFWRQNWSKIWILENQEDKKIFDSMQLIAHNFISSKARYTKEGVIYGKKPDFRLLCKHGSEILFGEAKPPITANCRAVTNQAFIKLATFMKDALDTGVHGETYGVIVNVKLPRLLYQFASLVELILPAEAAEFIVILNVVERCYELKEMILETEQRRMKKNTLLNMNYQHYTNSSPAKTKVPIINAHAF